MNTFHHFGDSYATTLSSMNVKHFGELISDNLNFKYQNLAFAGASNEQILNNIIINLNKFKKEDILFINFSFFARGCWYDSRNKKINSTNLFYDELASTKLFKTDKWGYSIYYEKIMLLVDYYITHTEDYVKRIFSLLNSTLKYIESIGVKIYYIFVDDAAYSDDLLQVGNNLKFKNGFSKWLIENEFHNEEEGHYSAGIQNFLSNMILEKTNNFDKHQKILI